MEITFTDAGLAQMSIDQHNALLAMIGRWKTMSALRVMKGGFDLPDGYLMFEQKFQAGDSIWGGISPEGRVST